MNLTFIADGPCLIVENKKRHLVACDLHFGIEADLAAHGLHFRSRSRDRLDRLLAAIDSAEPDALILLGDVKHNIPFLTRQEYYEMPKILKTLRDRVPLRVFPGNHDVGIGRYLENDERMPTDGCCVDGTGYLHGHTYPSPALAGNLIISGHHHPMVSLRDDVGCSLQSPAYIRAGLDEAPLGLAPAAESGSPTRVLFMPAFNEIAGYDILRITKHPFSPLSRHMQRENAEVILADGTYIGPLGILDDDERD